MPLRRDHFGYHRATVDDVGAGADYLLRLDAAVERPDPASRLQPHGVHGASRVVDLDFAWSDGRWGGLPLAAYVLYELHVGTFTRAGTFAAAVAELPRLRELGVTAVEIMPVAQFPGTRNWGYDGVYPFAVQASYGGPRGLQELVDACHGAGLAVVLDVVYNHLGPEGNYLSDFGPYFTDAHRTPWGAAINFDGAGSDHVRRFFIENALQWISDFHCDGLRLDAVHAIVDPSARPFLEELGERVHQLGEALGRNVVVMAESDLNDPRLVRDAAAGGCGLDAMWCDDFHHAAHALLTGEGDGYYADFGGVGDLARAWTDGMTYQGQYSAHRQRRHGRPGAALEPSQVVVCVQNHDQVGNRMGGERLASLVDFEAEKTAAGLVIMAPQLPLLFMGQEYGETAPFQYFVSHGDPPLVEAVRRGRGEEFASFSDFAAPGAVPDPQSEATFRRSILDPDLRRGGRHALLHELYRRLLALRRRCAANEPDTAVAAEAEKVLFAARDDRAWLAFHLAAGAARVALPVRTGIWKLAVDSAATHWDGPGSDLAPRLESRGEVVLTLPPWSFAVYVAAPAARRPAGMKAAPQYRRREARR